MADVSKITLPGGSAYNLKDSRIAYCTCPTAAGTAAKVVTVQGNQFFSLVAGAIIGVKFTYTNTASNVTLNVNNTGAKSIWYDTGIYSSNASAITGYAGRTLFYMYDGTYWQVINKGWIDSDTNTYTSAYCTTAAGSTSKTATCSGYYLLAKSYLHVIITNSNTANSALTLNVNGAGAKPIYINGIVSSSSNYNLPAGSYIVYYDGTNYYFRTDGKLTANITGDAGTVNGHTVNSNVPSSAVFTDTTYTISMQNNVITLTSSTGGTSTVTLPVYNGGVT